MIELAGKGREGKGEGISSPLRPHSNKPTKNLKKILKIYIY